MASPLTADELIPLVGKLDWSERARLVRILLKSAPNDAVAYSALPPMSDEFSSDTDALSWDADGWDASSFFSRTDRDEVLEGAMTRPEEVIQAALDLPKEARARFLEVVSASLDGVDLDPSWEVEIARRVVELDAGSVETVEASLVFDKLEKRFGGK